MSAMELEQPCLQSGCKTCSSLHGRLIEEEVSSRNEDSKTENVKFDESKDIEMEGVGQGDKEPESKQEDKIDDAQRPDSIPERSCGVQWRWSEVENGDTNPWNRPPQQGSRSQKHLTERSPSPFTLPPPFVPSSSSSYSPVALSSDHSHDTSSSLSPRGILKSVKRKRDDTVEVGNEDEQPSPRKKVRFRHRVRCVFRSEEGKEKFKGLVQGR